MKIDIMTPIKKGLGLCGTTFGALALIVPFMAFGLASCDQNDDDEFEEDEVEEVEIGDDDEM